MQLPRSQGRRLKKSHALTLFTGAVVIALCLRQGVVARRRVAIANPAPSEQSSQRFNQCVVQANRELKERFATLKEAQVPLFSDVVIAPKDKDNKQDLRMYLIFGLEFISGPKFANNPDRAREILDSDFWCDGQPGELVKGGDPKLKSMVVECPYNSNLKNFEIKRKDPKESIASYDISAHVSCAVNHPYAVPQVPPKYAMTAFVFGDIYRKYLVPWVEYHRLIGFDHFFIFVNEDYDEERMSAYYPDKDYITYIPNKKTSCSWCFVQETSETHAIFLSRAFAGSSIEWLAIADPDEYIQVMNHDHCPRYHILPRDNIPEKEIALFLDPLEKSDIGGVRIKNWDFGIGPRDKDQDSPQDHQGILLDYVWSSPTPTHFGREKHIIRPFENYYYTTHHASVGGPRLSLDPYCEVRLAHIKIVNTKEYASIQPETYVRDTSIRDKYRNSVVERMGGSIDGFGVFRHEYGS